MKKHLKKIHTFISKYSTKSNLLILSLSCFIFSLILTRTLLFLEEDSFIREFRTYISVSCIYASFLIFATINGIKRTAHVIFMFGSVIFTIILVPYWLKPIQISNPNILIELLAALVSILVICYYLYLFTKIYHIVSNSVNKMYSTIFTSGKHKTIESILKTLTTLFVSLGGLIATLTAIIINFKELWK